MSTAFQPDSWQSDAWQIAGGVTVLVLECDPGSYLVDGEDADFTIQGSLTIECDSGAYEVTGAPLGFEIGVGLLEPKLAPKRRYPNVSFRPAGRKRRDEPVVARATPAPKPRASGLLLNLLKLLPDEPVALPLPPIVIDAPDAPDVPGPLELLEQVVLPREPDAPVSVAVAAPAPDPMAALAALEARMQTQIAALQAEVAEIKAQVSVEILPVLPAHDPLGDALHAILPGLTGAIDLGPSQQERLRSENERRAREITERLLADL